MRANRLSNALAAIGVEKGDKFAILAYNCVERSDKMGIF